MTEAWHSDCSVMIWHQSIYPHEFDKEIQFYVNLYEVADRKICMAHSIFFGQVGQPCYQEEQWNFIRNLHVRFSEKIENWSHIITIITNVDDFSYTAYCKDRREAKCLQYRLYKEAFSI